MYQQDNSPVYKSKQILAWLKKHKFKTIDWPPQSPDIKPTKNLRAIVKRKMAKKSAKTQKNYMKFLYMNGVTESQNCLVLPAPHKCASRPAPNFTVLFS